MNFRVFSENNWAEYKHWHNNNALGLDIYYHPFYLECEEFTVVGNRKVLLVENGENFLLYPFIQQFIPIPNFEAYSDIISPYGYGGPFWSGNNSEFKLKSEKIICDYLKENNVVNELIRYHYLYNRNATFEINIENSINRKVVLVELNEQWEKIWSDHFSATNRNLIRKLEKENYECFETSDLYLYDAFINMYYQTMDNVGASKYYYFSKEYFDNLRDELGGKVRLFVVTKDEILYNAALFFFTDKIVTYHLSARNLSFPKVPGSNYLLSTAVKEFSGGRRCYLNLGGGSDGEENNYLLKFKRNFSKTTFDFSIGKRIHLPEIYQKMKEAYYSLKGQTTKNEKSNILQFYR